MLAEVECCYLFPAQPRHVRPIYRRVSRTPILSNRTRDNASCQLVEATSHPILSTHRSTSETCTHRYSPNRSYKSSETSTMASLTVSHDQRYSDERRTCAMMGLSRPREIASVTRGQVSIHRHCPRDPFSCMNRLKPLKAQCVTTATSLLRASSCKLDNTSCRSASSSCLIGWNCLSAKYMFRTRVSSRARQFSILT